MGIMLSPSSPLTDFANEFIHFVSGIRIYTVILNEYLLKKLSLFFKFSKYVFIITV